MSSLLARDGAFRQRVVAALLLLAAFLLFFTLASRFVDPFALVSQKGPLGGDTFGGAEIFLKLKYEWKRPLMGPVVWGATSLFRLVPGVSALTAMALGLALLATANLGLAYLVARRLSLGRLVAVLATGCYALFLSTLIGLSITDSYTVSSLAVLIVLYVWLGQPSPATLGARLRLGMAIAVAGLCNTPLLLLAGLPVLYTFQERRPGEALRQGLVVGGTALALIATVVLVHAELKYDRPWAYVERSSAYNARYADADRLDEPLALADVAASFFAFAVAAPEPSVPGRLKSVDLEDYVANAGGLLGLAAVAVTVGLALAALLGRHRRLALPVAAFLLALTLFYTYFNPPDAMLYSVQLRPALLVLVALGAVSLPGPRRLPVVALLLALTLLATRNLPIVAAGPYDFRVRTAPAGTPARTSPDLERQQLLSMK